MALIDVLDQINQVLTFYERVINLRDRTIISAQMFEEMEAQIIAYLETFFPPPPPPA